MSKVKVTADAAGNVIVRSKNNPDYGYIRVQQDRFMMDENGFMRRKTLSALVLGLVNDLQSTGWKAGDEIEGKVITKESLVPFNKQSPERDYKIAGNTGIVCCIEGEPIYRKNFYKTDGSAQDEWIRNEEGTILTHTNSDAIKAAYAEASETVETQEEELN
jgi:hypothetical protein